MKSYRGIAWLLALQFLIPESRAQDRITEHEEQLQAGYFSQLRFSDHSGALTEIQVRTKEDFVSDLSVLMMRLGYTYFFNNDAKLSAGYAFVNHFPDGNYTISRPEHRPWQQLQWHQKYHSMHLIQTVRLEERFKRKFLDHDHLSEDYAFNFRARYGFLSQFALGSKKLTHGNWSLVLSDEIFINFGKEIVKNYFDQNRLFAGFQYQITPHTSLQGGYMNMFLQLPAGNVYRMSHIGRLMLIQNLDLRFKK